MNPLLKTPVRCLTNSNSNFTLTSVSFVLWIFLICKCSFSELDYMSNTAGSVLIVFIRQNVNENT